MTRQEKRDEIIKAYKDLKNYTKVGMMFKISKQRVEQVVKKYGDLETGIIVQGKHIKNYTDKCLECGRLFGKVKHMGHGLCGACIYFRHHASGRIIRKIMYPGNCRSCNKDITKERGRAQGYCRRCYVRDYLSHTESFKKTQDRYRLKNKEKIREKSKIYHKAYRERQKEVLNGVA